ncbi:hypothetical protein V1460_17105 [Streptomyces sp. SCSIO 30461]|uniref:hypothetical protein n=1 Tax=Streptomyces sp. SCSIO 30461 TaxID=3118085 RepID=UPI0030CBB35D
MDANAVHLAVRLAAPVDADGRPGPTVLDCQGCRGDWFPLSDLATLDALSTQLSAALTTVLRARTHISREQPEVRRVGGPFEIAVIDGVSGKKLMDTVVQREARISEGAY